MYRWFVVPFSLLLGCAAPDDAASTGSVDTVDAADSEDAAEVQDASDSDNDGESEDAGDAQGTGDAGDVETDEDEDAEDPCPDSWVLTYGIEGHVDITNTPLDIGNATAMVGGLETDELVIRVADNGGEPAEGEVLITSFELLQDFTVSVNLVGEIALETYLMSSAQDECGLATGELQGSTISWDECTFGPDHGTTKWSPDEGASGQGCISDYHVEGTVDCIDDSILASCGDGWLEDGLNTLDYVYDQPMLSLEFDSDNLERFTMEGTSYGAELPTYTNNRTWLTLDGTLKSMTLEPTPDCLCAE